MGRQCLKIDEFRRSTRAASAVEFAVVFPTLLIFMLFGIQLVAYINAVRRVGLLATSMSQMLSQATPPDYSTTIATVNQLDLHFAFDSALVIFPYLMKDAAQNNMLWWQDIIINFASVQFTSNGTTCSASSDKSACYVANVVWTSAGLFASNARPCVTPQLPAADTAGPNRTTIPRSVFGPGSILVVDVVFTFKPTFGARYLPNLPIKRSVYVQPRYATLINFDTTNTDGIAIRCPGY